MQPFTVEQARAARAFLGWSQHELGDAAGLSFETIRNFERDDQSATKKSITAIRTAFHDAGVEFHRRGGRGSGLLSWCGRKLGKESLCVPKTISGFIR
jgi:transcriptional regulator with XRE-family HTH domain